MDASKNSQVSSPDYPVIYQVNNSGPRDKVIELSSILDYWELYENNTDDPVQDTVLQTAQCGSSFGGGSPRLTIRQLFSVWRSGRLIHSAYYDKDGNEIHENLYRVGMGCGLSGAYVFWGIVPSRKTIVISDRSPIREICSIAYNMPIYKNAANPWKASFSELDEISEREWLGSNDFRGSLYGNV
ncbi:MAG: hypothetical protein STSR0009_27430 [Methanoregula sp.]